MMKVIFRCKEYIYLAGTYLVGILEFNKFNPEKLGNPSLSHKSFQKNNIDAGKSGNSSFYRALPLKAFPKL